MSNVYNFYNINKKYEISNILWNNETLGITMEKLICNIYKLKNDIDEKRVDNNIINNIINDIKNIIYDKINIIEYSGSKNKSYIDFLCNQNKTLSLKTNKGNNKVCPQKIGQMTNKKFKEFFNISENDDVKKYIIENINNLCKIYIQNLFICDFLLYIKTKVKKGKYMEIEYINIIEKDIIHIIFSIIDKYNIKFTKNKDTWKESNTIKIGDVSIAEIQIHNNRNCIKFRFIIENIIKMINENDKLNK